MQAPKPGTVMGNHVYVGGDPGDQKSWKHVGALNQEFSEAQDKFGRISRAREAVSGETRNGYFPDMRTGVLADWTKGLAGFPSRNMMADLAPVIAKTTLGTITEAKNAGGSLGTNPTDFDAQIYATAVQNLKDNTVPAEQYLNELNVAGGVLGRRYPGLTPDQPLILQEGRSRADLPKGAFYRSPDGATRKNVSGNAGNDILWTPANDPQKAYKDAKLAWNDRWYQRKGNLDGADAAFNQWWASYSSGGQKKAPPPLPGQPPRAAGGRQSGVEAMPQAGEVRDGWRFKGGNPNDQRNWQKVTP